MADHRYKPLAEAALEVARARARKLEALRRAILDGDEAEVWRIARRLTGLGEDDAGEERRTH